MLTALLRWMSQSRRERHSLTAKTTRLRQSRGAGIGRACDLLPLALQQLWNEPPHSRSLDLGAFEDRLLFNAAPVPAPAPAPVATEVVVVALVDPAVINSESTPPPVNDSTATSDTSSTVGILSQAPGTSAATLIVVDPSVPDYETLLDQFTSRYTGPSDLLILDSQKDGLEQIAERLELLGETRAIHILSHGDEAGLHLGSNWLSTDTISFRSNTLAQWQSHLTSDADVLFYGCDLAANSNGQQFLRTFADLTGADVAASTDATGAAILGGDWNLEFQYGAVETPSLGVQLSLFEWNGLLTTNTYQQGISGYTGTQDTSIKAVAPGTSDGSAMTVSVGGASSNTGLLRFDGLFGSGARQIPLGSTIHSASLRVNVTSGTGTESTISLHRVLSSWTEASTWNTTGNGLSRDNKEVSTVADALVTGTTVTGTRTILGLEDSLQAWADGEANNGWALFGDNAAAWAFTSSEGATVALRPMLIVDFTPPTVALQGELLATGETRINVSTTNAQSTATNGRNSHDAVGVDANGNYVVVWTSDPGDGSGAGVYGQRFNSRGLAQGGQFRINQTTTDNQQWASVAMKADGGFIVTWTSQNQDGAGQGVYARIFTAAGVGGTEFLVNTTTTGTQQASSLGVAADGTFVIAWEGSGSGDTDGIFAQRFSAGGSKLGGEILVNQATPGTLYDPAIAVGQDGRFMVVWDSPSGTTGRRFLANGTAKDANDILLHGDITSGNADVATNGTGDYHIVWRTTGGGDGSGRAIWRMSLGATDTAATALFQVPANSINDQTEPAITSDAVGDFIVTWQGAGPGDTAGVFARKFRSDGTAVGTEFQLNETVSGSQIAVSAAIVDLDNFVTVWSGNGPGDATGVFSHVYGTMGNRSALLFTTSNDVLASGNPDLASWTTGDVVSFQQPNLILGENTTATLGIAGRLNASNDGGVKIEGIDYLQADVLVGIGANSIQLYAGDVLFSVNGTESFGPLTIQSDDIAVFRPAAPWNYSAGSIFVLFDGMESVAGGAILQRADFDLVDRDTQVGEVLLRAGELVIGDSGGDGNTIHVFQATGAGNGTTSGTAYTLLEATEINLGHMIQGVHLIERDVRIGATTLHSGELLLSVDQDTTIGGNSLSVTQNDVIRLLVEQTSVGGPAITTASIAIDGSDLALDTSGEALKSLGFTSVGSLPSVIDETYHLTEDEVLDSADLWYDTNWSSRISLTFDNASRAENLDDFPVLVTLDTNRFDYSLAKANGEDLRFVDANGQLLSHEIETWNPTGRSAIWVKVPRIDAGSRTDSIHMYYGNAAAADIQNSTGVWSNGYVGVWHLNGNPSGTQTIADASSSNKDGTSIGMDATNQVSGPIGGALKFDGSTEAIRIGSNGTDPLAIDGNHLTVEAWVNSTGGTGDWETILNRRNIVITPIQSYGLKTALSDQSQVVHTTGTPDLSGVAGALPDDQWKYLTGVLSGSTSNLYVNGIQNATGTTTSFGSGSQDVTIGAAEAGYDSVLSQYWKGGIDEVRISNVARSAAWTAAQYASMTDTLITYGERQTVAGLLDNDQSATTGGLVVSSVDLSNLTGGATATVQDDGQVRFVPGSGFQNLADGQSVSQQITYTAMDSNGNTNTATATFVIHGVNDAPVNNALVGPLKLTGVDEGATNPAGNTVLEILTSAAGTLITDVDSGAVQGIAVTAVDTTSGTWQYSIDGTTWSSLTGVSDTNATLLDTSSHVRFIPAAGFSGAAGAMTFRAWDQTSGTNAQIGVNVSVNGGATAFSAQTTTASIAVIPLNTAPVVVTNAGMSVSEGGTALLSSTRLAASDSENTPAQLTYTLSSSPTHGRMERVAAPGVAITTFTQAEMNSNAIRYVHDGSETTSDGFSFSLGDGTVTVTGSFSITVTPVNDSQVVTANTGLTVVEGGNGLLTNTRLSASDSDNTAAQLVYTVTTSPANGRLERVATPGVAITTFTQADLNGSSIRYVHNGGETTSDSFSFTVSDGSATVTGSFAITVTPVNDVPVVSVNTGLSVVEGGDGAITNARLSASDSDNTAAQLVYTVTTSPANGRVERVAAPGATITTFTQADINSNAIRYVHNGGETTSDSFSFSLSDGATTVNGSFAITVTPVNDAPVITVNAGMTVVEGGNGLLANTKLSGSDSDNSAAQLTYTVSTIPINGRIERVATPGITITSFTQAELNSNAIRYVHNGGETTSDSFSFSLSDGTATVTDSFAITVTPVNDAPIVSINTGLTVAEGSTGVLTNTKLAASDPDNTAAQRVYTVATNPIRGRLESSSNQGVSITSFTEANINAGTIRYVHDGGESTSDSFAFSLSDGTASVTGSFALTITAVNDTPVIATNLGETLPEGGSVIIGTNRLSANDVDNSMSELVFTVSTSPANGRLERVATPGTAITTFTQADLNSNVIRYVHNGGETTSDSFSFSLSDGTALVTGTFLLTITPVNDAPVMAVNAGLVVVEAGSGGLANTNLLASDPDNTAYQLVYTLTTAPSHGHLERVAAPGTAITTLTQAEINSGAIRYVHDGSQTTSDTLSFSLSDGTATISSSLSITIAPVNNSPSLIASQMTITEGQSLSLSPAFLLATDADTSPNLIQFRVTAVTNGRFEFVAAPGTSTTAFTQDDINNSRVRFIHNGGEAAPTATTSVSDGTTTLSPSAMLISFSHVNDPPTVTSNTGLTLSEGGTATLTNLMLATGDPDNTPAQLVFTVTSSPSNGRLELSTSPGVAIASFTQAQINSGSIRYVHNGGETSADGFSFSLSDGTASAAGSFAMTVTPVNDAPAIMTTPGLTTLEGGSVTITASFLNATDPDSGPASLTYSVSGGLGFGHLALASTPASAITTFTQAQVNANQIVYVHDGAESTLDYFSFTVSDGAFVTTGSLSIAITPINDLPVFDSNRMTIVEGQTLTLSTFNLLINDSDTPATALIYTVNSVTEGRFEWASAPGTAITSFTQNDINTARIRFVHNGSGAAPTASLTITDGVAIIGPNAMAITFSNVNNAPTISINAGLTLNEGASAIISNTQLAATDPDNSAAQLVYTFTAPLTNGRIEKTTNPGVSITSFTQANLNSGVIRYVHNGGDSTSDSLRFSLSDGSATVTGSFSITVTPVNDPPTLTAHAITVNEGQTVTLSAANLGVNDSDSATITFTVSSVAHGEFRSTQTGSVVTSFTQAQIAAGSITFRHDGTDAAPSADVSASDGAVSTATVAITFTYTPVNDLPVIDVNAGLTVNEGGTRFLSSLNLSASDSDNTPSQLVYTLTSSPNHGLIERVGAPGIAVTTFSQLDLNTNQIRYVHDGGETTTDTLSFTLTDGASGFATNGIMTITITPVNDPPVLTNSTITIDEGQSVILSSSNLSASDSDSSNLQFTVSGVSHGVFKNTATGMLVTTFSQSDIQSGLIRLIHDGSEIAPAAQVSVSDGSNSTSPIAFQIMFTNLNDAPNIAPSTFTVPEGAANGSSVGQVVVTDSDSGDTHTFSLQHGPSSALFSIDPVTGLIRVIDGSSLDFETLPTHELQVVVIDQHGATAQTTIRIDVINVNDPPVALGFPVIHSVEDGPLLSLDLRPGFNDPDSSVLSFQILSVNNPALFTSVRISPEGVLMLDGSSNSHGTCQIQIQAADQFGLTATTTVEVVLAAINDAPSAIGESYSTSIGDILTLSSSSLLTNDADIDSTSLAIVIQSQPTHGQLISNGDGTFTYLPVDGYSGDDSFQYFVTDGTAQSSHVTVQLAVNPIGPGSTNNSTTTNSTSNSGNTDTESTTSFKTTAGSKTTSTSSSITTIAGVVPLTSVGPATNGHPKDDESNPLAFIALNVNDDLLEGTGSRGSHPFELDDANSRNRTSLSNDTNRLATRSLSSARGLYETAMSGGLLDSSISPSLHSVTQLRAILASSANQTAFAHMSESLKTDLMKELIFEVPALAGASLTVGYVVWMLRGGVLITSLLAQMPAWRIVDPLVVLDSLDKSDQDDESIGSLLEQGQTELEPSF